MSVVSKVNPAACAGRHGALETCATNQCGDLWAEKAAGLTDRAGAEEPDRSLCQVTRKPVQKNLPPRAARPGCAQRCRARPLDTVETIDLTDRACHRSEPRFQQSVHNLLRDFSRRSVRAGVGDEDSQCALLCDGSAGRRSPFAAPGQCPSQGPCQAIAARRSAGEVGGGGARAPASQLEVRSDSPRVSLAVSIAGCADSPRRAYRATVCVRGCVLCCVQSGVIERAELPAFGVRCWPCVRPAPPSRRVLQPASAPSRKADAFGQRAIEVRQTAGRTSPANAQPCTSRPECGKGLPSCRRAVDTRRLYAVAA